MTLSALKMWAARFAPLLILLAASLLLSTGDASAHAKLTRSEPKAGAKLDRAPGRVELWFSEELGQGLAAVEVTDARGARVGRGGVTLADGNKKAQVELNELAPGAYTVTYKVVSTDEHTIRGKFTFTVTAAAASSATTAPAARPQGAGSTGQQQPPAAAPPEAGADKATAGVAEESAVTWADNAIRWLAYLAMMTLFGGFAAWLFVLTPALRRSFGQDTVGTDGAAAAGARRTVKLLWIALVVLAAALSAALVYQSAAVNGVGVGAAASPAALARVITETGYGVARHRAGDCGARRDRLPPRPLAPLPAARRGRGVVVGRSRRVGRDARRAQPDRARDGRRAGAPPRGRVRLAAPRRGRLLGRRPLPPRARAARRAIAARRGAPHARHRARHHAVHEGRRTCPCSSLVRCGRASGRQARRRGLPREP
jgi:copper resistance protein C